MATRAVFLDALGTLVELEPPWARLACALGDTEQQAPQDRRGSATPRIAHVEHAMRREMAYYREHAHEGTDREALADLRRRCAELLSTELGREVDVETMMSAIRFHPAPDARPALVRLGELGLRRVCVSNWDISLDEVLAQAGLGELLDGVVTSAATGSRKPEPQIFRVALELAGCEPGEALHVGDTPEEDVAGASAAGVPVLLLDRSGGTGITSLLEIEQHLRR